MQGIAELLAQNPHGASLLARLSSEHLSPLEIAQRKADRENAEPGMLNQDDGINCDLCMNRGYTMEVEQGANGCIYTRCVVCKCNDMRQSFRRMKQSGLERSIREQTFQRFEVKEPWQQMMVDKAKQYLAEGAKAGKWFYAGGQPGCGKTHICTAIARELLRDMAVHYVIWEQVAKQIKAVINEADEYSEEIGKLERAEVLYIDDLFKPVKDEMGKAKPPTPADVRLAFEVINYRYINRMPTIISSEWYPQELMDFDEATASRILERSKGFILTIGREKSRNYRIQDDAIL